MRRPKLNIGFISTRLAGTDGVSLETEKWAQVLKEDGHRCFYMAGELDTPKNKSFLVPECHFVHPDIIETYNGCFGRTTRSPETTLKIEKIKHKLKDSIAEFVKKFDLNLLIPENALTIPLNIPLGLAITEYTIETGIQVISHHHDFFWERKRFMVNACWDYLNKAFPPHLPTMQHAVINSSQDNQISLRTGISARIIPNVMDFSDPAPPPDGYETDLRDVLGIRPEEKFILQPTRIVQRKGIEHAIELIDRLDVPARLVISHASGDEGDDYAVRVREYSELLGIDTIFCSDIVDDVRGKHGDGRKIYTLRDFYYACDLVTYPSTIEGFGNAFLEAVYYRRPIMVNNYSIYNTDIKPKGFKTIEMNDYVSKATVEQARKVLQDPTLASEMTEVNYRLAEHHFSHEVLRQKLRTMLINCFGT